MTGLLQRTFDRHVIGDSELVLVVGPPEGAGWTSVAGLLADPSLVAGFVAELRDRHGGRSDVAGSFLAAELTAVIAGPLAGVLVEQRRGWPLVVDRLWVHRHDDGWFDGVAVEGATVWVLPDDPDRGDESAAVLDSEELDRAVGAQIVAVLTELFAAIRRQAPYGLRGMWGATADGLASTATWRARQRDEDGAAAFEDAMRVVDQIAAVAPYPITRPTLTTVDWSGGTSHFATKGTCCLWYRADPDSSPTGDGYCAACPLRPVESRRQRWAAWLERAED